MGREAKKLKRVRKLRHWKQRYDPNARFVWRRRTLFNGKRYEPGELVDEDLIARTKLRRFWESHRIELAEFEAPNVATGQAEAGGDEARDGEIALPAGAVVEQRGSWFAVTLPGREEPIKVHGEDALRELAEELAANDDTLATGQAEAGGDEARDGEAPTGDAGAPR